MEKREQDLLYKIEVGTVCVGRTQEKKTQTVEARGCGSSLYCIGGRNHSIPESDENGKIGFGCDKQC